MRRSASHAKIVQRHENRKASVEAETSSARFNSKQSRFQLRQEEKYVQDSLQPVTPQLRQSGSMHTSHHNNNNVVGNNNDSTSSTFSRFERPSASSSSSGLRLPTTTATATFGLAPTRSARRAAKFRLEDNENTSTSQSLGAGLLGSARRTRDDDNNNDFDSNNNESGAPQRKKTREERFQQILANSKESRARAQRDREERAQQTTALDAEFNGVMHLLERRNRAQEERDAFASVGTPQMRELLSSFRENHVAKTVSLRSDGSFSIRPLAEKAVGNNVNSAAASGGASSSLSSLDEKSMALLKKIREEANDGNDDKENTATTTNNKNISKATGGGGGDSFKGGDVNDDFDFMMQAMRRETRRAIAGDRTLTAEEEEAQRERQQLIEADRSAVPLVTSDGVQLTRAEWVSRGGDHAYQMHDDDNNNNNEEYGEGEAEDSLDISSAYDSEDGIENNNNNNNNSDDDVDMDDSNTGIAPVASGSQLDEILSAMETFSREADMKHTSRAARNRTYYKLLQRLYNYASNHLLHTAQAFRLLLIEAQRSFLRRGSLDQTTLLLLHAISRIFPMTDYRHEVTTPFLLFLSSALLQMRLKTLEHVRVYSVLAGLLGECVLAGGKFCSEAVIAPLNIIALQLPRCALEPVRLQGVCVPFPLVERGGENDDEVLLRDDNNNNNNNNNNNTNNNNDNDNDNEPPLQATFALMETNVNSTCILRYAYRLLSLQADALRGVPAFSYCLAEPFFALHKQLTSSSSSISITSSLVHADHAALLDKLSQFSKESHNRRTPLAMRSFRPRPLRQFEPLLQETSTTALKNEVRTMKREMREDHKRVVRHVQAAANVERRQREREMHAEEMKREQKYRELMGSLQAQQHVMNKVDGLIDKAKSKKRKSISGRAGNNDGSGDN